MFFFEFACYRILVSEDEVNLLKEHIRGSYRERQIYTEYLCARAS